MHPERKPGANQGGAWSVDRVPYTTFAWSPQNVPPALADTQRWARSSEVLPKTAGCHQERQVFQAAHDQLFVRTGWTCRTAHGCTANISPLPCPGADLNDPSCQKQLLQMESGHITLLWSGQRVLCLSCVSHHWQLRGTQIQAGLRNFVFRKSQLALFWMTCFI